MRLPPAFYRTAALLSALSALTTLVLIFAPRMYVPVEGFEGRMARVHDDWYQFRAWIYLLHPFITGAAALAVCLRLRLLTPASALVAAAGFALWACTEAAQQCLTLFAFDEWRIAYGQGDAALRVQMPVLTTLYDGVWDAMYVLLLTGIIVGSAALAIALARGRGLTRVIGLFYAAAVLLSLRYLLPELGWNVSLGAIEPWVYPATQPLARVLIGVWLWRFSVEDGPQPLNKKGDRSIFGK